ncbi:MAG TPA: hypothetical protein VNQ90_09035 [Chthoniobacteraceae bacterium]|nr:hypothetical protein [Chthoniobacteraceae bacterium]
MGGGLAGLTLGIALRQRAVAVELREALGYPRHRVCGEFICGRGLGSLQRLGLLPLLYEAGGRPARSFALFMAASTLPPRDLPSCRPAGEGMAALPGAFCVSRWTLDALLAAEFERLGGVIRRERHPLAEGGGLKPTPEGVVDATGRKLAPKGALAGGKRWRWTGIKAHVRHLPLVADLELHFGRDAYVGLCRLARDEVNVCGLFRHDSALARLADNWRRKLAQPPSLSVRLKEAQWVEGSFCAVSGLDFRPVATPCRIGDALGMLPPFTGNGMSAAFESAELAVAPLAAYALGRQSWEEACRCIGSASRKRFGLRRFWGRLIHPMLFHPAARGTLFGVIERFPFLAGSVFRATR